MTTVKLYNDRSREEREKLYEEYVKEHKASPAYSDSPMCKKCLADYKQSYVNGELIYEIDEEEYELRKLKDTLPAEVFFPISCSGDLRHGLGDLSKAVTDLDFATAGLFNPDVWFKEELGIELRWYQSESAACTAKAKVDRWGRRCLPASEKVLLSNLKEISIQDIQIGDKVICTEENVIYKTEGEVLEKWEDGIKDIYKITLADKRKIRCTINHPIMIVDKEDGHWYWSTIEEGVSVGEQVMCLIDPAKGSYSCEQIIGIVEDGSEMVYDITVNEYHNFIVNGIVTHNTGKTHHKVGGLLHKMQLGKGLDDNNKIIPERILVVAPYQPQVDEIFDKIDLMIDNSRTLKSMIVTRRRTPNQVLILDNGSRITGFCVGADSGTGSDKTKGQDATLIYGDELELMVDEDVESFMAIMASKADSEFWVTSTPTGRRGKFFSFCRKKELGFKETHITSMQSPEWTEVTERILRLNYSRASWEHNILADFGTVEGGVFQTAMLEAGLRDYSYGPHLLAPGCIVSMGVDWNGVVNGNPIIVVAYYPTNNCYMVVDKYISANKDYTQLTAIQDIIRMYHKWNPHCVYLDHGFGNTNYEILRKYANNSTDKTMLNKMKSIMMQGAVEIRDPITKQLIKKQNKALMIDLAVQRVEANMCHFPFIENNAGNLVDQMRNFKIERYTPNGLPVYSQGKDHELVAWCLAMFGITMEFSDLAKMDGRGTISYLPPSVGTKDLLLNNKFETSLAELMRDTKEAELKSKDWKEPPTNGDIKLNSSQPIRPRNSFTRGGTLNKSRRINGRRSF